MEPTDLVLMKQCNACTYVLFLMSSKVFFLPYGKLTPNIFTFYLDQEYFSLHTDNFTSFKQYTSTFCTFFPRF